MSRLLLFAALLGLAGFPAPCRAQVTLGWKLKEKDQFYVETRMLKLDKARGGTLVSEAFEETHIVARLKVLKATDDGYELEKLLGYVDLRILGNPQLNPLYARLKGAVLRVKLNRELQVTTIEGLETLVSPIPDAVLLPHQKAELEKYQAALKGWFQYLFMASSAPKARIGDSWQDRVERMGNAQYGVARTFRYAEKTQVNGKTLHRVTLRGNAGFPKEDEQSPLRGARFESARFEGELFFDASAADRRAGRYDIHLEARAQTRGTPSAPPVNVQVEDQTLFTFSVTSNNPLEHKDASSIRLAGHQTEEKRDLPRNWTNSLKMQLILLPPGKFVMGSKGFGGSPLEEAVEVEITRPVYMAAHEVTIGQYRRFVEATGYRTDAERHPVGCFGFNKETGKLEMSSRYSWKNPGWDHDDRHPAVNLTWEDAKAFCEWLSMKEGKTYRLPREAEWEYACRAGTDTVYSSGDEPESLVKTGNIVDASAKKLFPQWQAHSGDDGFVFSSPVGSFAPNAFGFYDMHGNAHEWCEDWLFHYSKTPQRDPVGPAFGTQKVQRGGSFADFPKDCTSRRRNCLEPNSYSISSGFRVVCCDETPQTYLRQPGWIGKTVLPRDPDCLLAVSKDYPRPIVLPAWAAVREQFGLVQIALPGLPRVEKEQLIPVEEAVTHFTGILERGKTVRYLMRSTAHGVLKNYDAAIADINAAIELDGENAWLYLLRGYGQHKKGDFAAALKDMRKAAEMKDDNPWPSNAVAWYLATCPAKEVRDGKLALEFGLRAKKLSPYRDGNILDTLAAAYAELGRFEEAIRCEQEALDELAFAEVSGPDARRRLEMYRRKEAFRQPMP